MCIQNGGILCLLIDLSYGNICFVYYGEIIFTTGADLGFSDGGGGGIAQWPHPLMEITPTLLTCTLKTQN